MTSDAKITRSIKLYSWIIPGASFTVAAIATIVNSEFVLQLAVWGTVILFGLWMSLWLLFKFLKIKPDKNARIASPGKQVHLFFIGAIAALWIPLIFIPFKAQKVEIILDVSQRMGEEFDAPGTTKLEAAQSGVLQVLGYLESQNVEVALRLVDSSQQGQCVIEPETSLAVDFTKDFDKIRNYLPTLQPAASENAPVVGAVDTSIDHYLDNRVFDQKFYLYSFIGGDDTCGEKLGVYLTSPKVLNNAINSELFLIILLGTDDERTLQNLPNAKLDYARSLAQVQQIVSANNQFIAIPTPTATLTLSPSPSSSPTSARSGLIPTQVGIVMEENQIEATNPPANLPILPAASHTPTAPQIIYLPPSQTKEPTQVPRPTDTFTLVPTWTPTKTFTPTVPPPPSLSFTVVPPLGTAGGVLYGQASNINPADYKVVVYIYAPDENDYYSWWIKPTDTSYMTDIQSDGNWNCLIDTGGLDLNANQIVAYLVPANSSPPVVLGGTDMPVPANYVASASAVR